MPLVFPSIPHPRAEIVTIIPNFTHNHDGQLRFCDRATDSWRNTELPPGMVSANLFASVGGESVLSYFQWESTQALRSLGLGVDGVPGQVDPPPFGTAWSPAYRLYRSLGATHEVRAPTSLICAYFDTDGTERQRHIADTLIEVANRLPPNPAALSAHFYLSLDGTRVVNYTEWSDAHSHDYHADKGAYDAIYEVSTSTPGVRSLRGNQYRLVAAVST